jgi:hypothetical protein
MTSEINGGELGVENLSMGVSRGKHIFDRKLQIMYIDIGNK